MGQVFSKVLKAFKVIAPVLAIVVPVFMAAFIGPLLAPLTNALTLKLSALTKLTISAKLVNAAVTQGVVSALLGAKPGQCLVNTFCAGFAGSWTNQINSAIKLGELNAVAGQLIRSQGLAVINGIRTGKYQPLHALVEDTFKMVIEKIPQQLKDNSTAILNECQRVHGERILKAGLGAAISKQDVGRAIVEEYAGAWADKYSRVVENYGEKCARRLYSTKEGKNVQQLHYFKRAIVNKKVVYLPRPRSSSSKNSPESQVRLLPKRGREKANGKEYDGKDSISKEDETIDRRILPSGRQVSSASAANLPSASFVPIMAFNSPSFSLSSSSLSFSSTRIGPPFNNINMNSQQDVFQQAVYRPSPYQNHSSREHQDLYQINSNVNQIGKKGLRLDTPNGHLIESDKFISGLRKSSSPVSSYSQVTQHDKRWSAESVGKRTMRAVGCYISSLSSIFQARGIPESDLLSTLNRLKGDELKAIDKDGNLRGGNLRNFHSQYKIEHFRQTKEKLEKEDFVKAIADIRESLKQNYDIVVATKNKTGKNHWVVLKSLEVVHVMDKKTGKIKTATWINVMNPGKVNKTRFLFDSSSINCYSKIKIHHESQRIPVGQAMAQKAACYKNLSSRGKAILGCLCWEYGDLRIRESSKIFTLLNKTKPDYMKAAAELEKGAWKDETRSDAFAKLLREIDQPLPSASLANKGDLKSVAGSSSLFQLNSLSAAASSSSSSIVKQVDELALKSRLMMDENRRFLGYRRSSDRWSPHRSVEDGTMTIGFGHKCSEKEEKQFSANPISTDDVLELFNSDVRRAMSDAKKLPFYDKVNVETQTVVTEMVYQMGLRRVEKFQKMSVALSAEKPDYQTAAQEMLRSKWAKSDSPQRALRAANRVNNSNPIILDTGGKEVEC